MKSLGNSISRVLFGLILFLSIVRFYFPFLPGVLSHWWFDMVILGLIPFWFIYTKERFTGLIKELFVIGIPLLLVLILPVLFADYPVNAVLNLVKIILYLLYIILFISISTKFYLTPKYFLKIIDVSFICVFIVAFIQLIDPPVLGSAIKFLFGDKFLRSLWTGRPRVFSTFNNANFFGVYLSFLLVVWLNAYLMFKKSVPWLLARFFPLMLLIVVSGSRTGMVAALCALLLTLLFHKFTLKEVLKYGAGIFIVSLISIGILSLFSESFETLFQRFQILLLVFSGDTLSDSSVSGRLERQTLALDYFMQQPLFGFGHRPDDIAPHNAYLTLLLCFGIVGFLGILLFVLFLNIRIFLQKPASSKARFFRRCYLVYTFALGVAMMAGDFVFTSQIMILWLLLAALSLAGNDQQYAAVKVIRLEKFPRKYSLQYS